MKTLLFILLLCTSLNSTAQYYYKDIIGTGESSDMIRMYMKNKVSRVQLTSFNSTNQKDDNFYVEQLFSPAQMSLRTIVRSYITNESVLTSFVDAKGNVIKTVDSSDVVISVTTYEYDADGHLRVVNSSSSDSANSSTENEQHQWQWNNGKPTRMMRVKNRKDTTWVSFRLDDNGNISEETETHRGVQSQPVYYYYNGDNKVTDIVRFSKRANRLLPEYMFEYTDASQVSQKITVPGNSSEYLIWRYQYDARGLRIKEVIYNKQKKLTGKIEYRYEFGM